MKTIIEPNEKVFAVISTRHPESECGRRLARWAVPFEEEGIFLMKHTFTGEVSSIRTQYELQNIADAEKADNSFNAQCIMHNYKVSPQATKCPFVRQRRTPCLFFILYSFLFINKFPSAVIQQRGREYEKGEGINTY